MIQSTISFYVMEFYKQFAAYTTQQLQEFGLSFGMMYFVIYVGKHPGCTPAEMTKNLHLDWGHCQRSVIKLVEDGFMTREKQGRSYHLGLTPAGESIPDLPPGIFRLGCTKFERADRRGTAPAPEPAAKGSTDEERECVTCTTPS